MDGDFPLPLGVSHGIVTLPLRQALRSRRYLRILPLSALLKLMGLILVFSLLFICMYAVPLLSGGSGWPAINSGNSTTPTPFNPNTPPTLPLPDQVEHFGPEFPGLFTSEFGCTSFSSFESMAPTLHPKDWGAHAPPM